MPSKEEEYKELFQAEAQDNFSELNRLITSLEKKPDDKKAIDAIFRITHTLKGNAAGMGFQDVASLAHTVEDFFGEIRAGKLILIADYFNDLFKAIDMLGALIEAIKTEKVVRYKGIKTKLDVLIRNNGNVETTTETIEDIDDKEAKPEKEEKKTKNTIKTPEQTSEKTETLKEIVDTVEADEEEESKVTFSDLVQVPVRKLDNLLNLVGELIIERDRIIAMYSTNHRNSEFSRLHRISSDLQYSVMDVRMVQVGFLFNKFHRVVRDAANTENKKAKLVLEGSDTEIDRNILRIISDSMIHLIRNCIGHGIELPADRKKAEKAEEGTISLKAYNENDAVIIEIKDDGKGIDSEVIKRKAIEKGFITKDLAEVIDKNEIIKYIFEPGFSSAETVTSISGRGVGMDVVKKAIDSIGGDIKVDSEIGIGTTIRLKLPSSMAVKGTLLFELEKIEYAIPLTFTEAVVSIYKNSLYKMGNGLVTNYLKNTIPVIFLKDLFEGEHISHKDRNYQKSYEELDDSKKNDIVVISYNGRMLGIVVDKLLQQKEIVEKPLSKPVDTVKIVSGVTILGNGNVCLILNIPMIIQTVFATTNR